LFFNIKYSSHKYPHFISKTAKSLIDWLLTKDSSKRPDIKSIKKHPFFQTLDWDELYQKKVKAPFLPSVENYGLSNFEKRFLDETTSSFDDTVLENGLLNFSGFTHEEDSLSQFKCSSSQRFREEI
jgi:serine/threonine protein kinase